MNSTEKYGKFNLNNSNHHYIFIRVICWSFNRVQIKKNRINNNATNCNNIPWTILLIKRKDSLCSYFNTIANHILRLGVCCNLGFFFFVSSKE